MTDEELIRAFHIMWDGFPETVMVIKKSREIIAVNKMAAEAGITPGIKCSSMGKSENHKGCLCDRAADSKKTVAIAYEGAFGKAFGYWIPIPEKTEWIIHFGVGYAHDYEKSDIKR